jgi:hypothetical protein
MDCLKSFNFFASGQSNFVAPDVKTWTTGLQEYWAFQRNGSSTFTVQGYKNINIYGVELIGNIGTEVVPALGGCIPTDWSIDISINGKIPLIGSIIAPLNDFNITDNVFVANNFLLGRFNPRVNFASPIESATSVSIASIRANGTGGQTTGNLNLQYTFNIIVYYKFEGE